MPFTPDNPLVNEMYRQHIKGLVQRAIFDQGGQLLDVRTCWVLWDADGDPAQVIGPKLAAAIQSSPTAIEALAAKGYTLGKGQP